MWDKTTTDTQESILVAELVLLLADPIFSRQQCLRIRWREALPIELWQGFGGLAPDLLKLLCLNITGIGLDT